MRKIIFLSLLTTLSLVISLFESIIPLPIPVPGAKLGLSNIVILVTLICFGFKETLVVSILKSFLQVLVAGNLSSLPYSLTGTIFSAIVMALSYRYLLGKLSLIGISELGAFAFNIGQILVASLVLNNFKIFTYLPFLTFIGIFTGYFVGLSSKFVSRKLLKVLNNNGKSKIQQWV